MSTGSGKETNFYYDQQSDQVLIGSIALEAHIEAGGHPADISSLEDFLASDKEVPDLRPKGKGNEFYAREWERQECLAAGRWLIKVANRRDHGGKYKLEGTLHDKAARLGFIPSRRRIGTRFGS